MTETHKWLATVLIVAVGFSAMGFLLGKEIALNIVGDDLGKAGIKIWQEEEGVRVLSCFQWNEADTTRCWDKFIEYPRNPI